MHAIDEVSTAGRRAKMFRCVGGKKFTCEEGHRVLSDRGITLLLSAPCAPEKSGI